MAKLTHEDILAYLEEATILELNDLVKAIEEKFDVTAAAPVAVAAAADAGAAAEPTEVNVTLTEVGGTKVAVSFVFLYFLFLYYTNKSDFNQ